MKQGWFAKDAKTTHKELIEQAKEPKVVEAVLNEIGTLGDNVKEQYDSMRKDHSFLKELVDKHKAQFDKLPADIKEHITKYTESVSTRQNELDESVKKIKASAEEMAKTIKEQQEEMDKIRTAQQRKGAPLGGGDPEKELKDAEQWRLECITASMKDEQGATFQRMQALGDVSVDDYRNYRKAMEAFIREPGDGRNLNPEQMKALTVGADPDGGFTVTPAMGARIIQRQFEIDPMRELAQIETITTGAIEWMVDWDQAGYGWEGETETGDETGTPGFKKVRIPVHVLYAKPRATQTLLEDSGINVEAWLGNHVARRFARAESSAFVSGDGVGKPRGFLTYSNYVTAGGASEWGRIEQIAMGNATNLTADGFNLVKYALVEYYLNRGTWMMNRTAVAEAMRLKDGDGQYIWRPGLEPNSPSVLLGLAVRMSTSMPVVAAGALSVALADWMETYMIVDRLGITIQRDPFTAKPFVEFYTRKRVGGNVVNFEAIKLGVVST